MQKVVILGSTGSIGCSTLSVINKNRDKYQLIAITAGYNVKKMTEQCLLFKPRFAAMVDHTSAETLRQNLKQLGVKTEVLSGEEAICQLAAHEDADCVIAAIIGAAGLTSTLAAIKASKRILLANKESLVTCGKIFMDAVSNYRAQLLPIDSEHNAIFQSLPEPVQHQLGVASLQQYGISKIVLTGSGGSFRDLPLEKFVYITPEQACCHPNWSMGKKITVDSATMMNKGLEYIEARWLFNASAKEMEIIIHPQSIIHSMVRYIDGSVIAQMGVPDMRTPIAQALAYPERINSGVNPLDFLQIHALTFMAPDFNRYPCLKLAIDAFATGQAATTALNAANEIAVDAFLNHKISFTDIVKINARILEKTVFSEPSTIDEVITIDHWARVTAEHEISHHY